VAQILVIEMNLGGRVAHILVIEMNLGAPRAAFARGVFDFAFASNLNRVNLHQTSFPFSSNEKLLRSPCVNPTRGAPNWAESSRLILSVILEVHSHPDSVGENPIPTCSHTPNN
jgi:hypothetical protein